MIAASLASASTSAWSTLVADLRRRHPTVIVEGATSLRLVLTTPNRSARVGLRVRRTFDAGMEVAVVLADLGPATGIDARCALEVNATLSASALVVELGVLYLRRLIDLDDMPRPAIDGKLRAHAAEAIGVRLRLRERTEPRPAPSTLMFHFSD